MEPQLFSDPGKKGNPFWDPFSEAATKRKGKIIGATEQPRTEHTTLTGDSDATSGSCRSLGGFLGSRDLLVSSIAKAAQSQFSELGEHSGRFRGEQSSSTSVQQHMEQQKECRTRGHWISPSKVAIDWWFPLNCSPLLQVPNREKVEPLPKSKTSPSFGSFWFRRPCGSFVAPAKSGGPAFLLGLFGFGDLRALFATSSAGAFAATWSRPSAERSADPLRKQLGLGVSPTPKTRPLDSIWCRLDVCWLDNGGHVWQSFARGIHVHNPVGRIPYLKS